MSGGFSFLAGGLEWVQKRGGGSQPLHGEGGSMDYAKAFAAALQALKDEGRYRVFADIRRDRGRFPAAHHYRGEFEPADHRVVLQRLSRHGPASGRDRGHARGHRCGRCGLRRHPQHLGDHALPRRAGGRAGRPARQGDGPPLHLRLRRQRHHAHHAAQAPARPGDLLRRQEPCFHDRRHPQRRRREDHLAQQRPGRPGGQAQGSRSRPAQGDRLRVPATRWTG